MPQQQQYISSSSSIHAGRSSLTPRHRAGYQSLPSLTETASSISLSHAETSIPTHPRPSIPGQAPANVHADLPSTSDIIIAVMGPTGAGKTTFISQAGGFDEEELVGHGLHSCTQSVSPFICHNMEGTRRVVLVDTPGFDDTNVSDLDILKRIADWLKKTYENDIKLSGLLYLHRISDNRMAGTPLRLLNTFQKICGDGVLKYVMLVTTMWGDVEEEVGRAREIKLCKEYWKTMINRGSRTVRFHNNRASAWDILSRFDNAPRQTLCLQRELVDRGLPLTETSAGKSLFSLLLDFIKRMAKALRRIQEKLDKTKAPSVRTPLQQQRDVVVTTMEAADQVRRRYNNSSTSDASWSIVRTGDESRDDITANDITPDFDNIPMTVSPISSFSDSLETISTPPASPTESTMEPEKQKHILQGTITVLGLLEKIIGLTPSPTFRPVIRLVLTLVKSIEQLESVDDSLVHMAERSAYLMVTLVENAGVGDITDKLRPHVIGVQQELGKVRAIVKRISSHKMANRILLADADREAIAGCERQISRACEVFGNQIGLINHKLIVHLEAALKELTLSRNACRPAPPADVLRRATV